MSPTDDTPPGYRETLKDFFALKRFGVKLDLRAIRALLGELGDPHLGLRAVHIGGTNGKGSAAAIVERALREAGLRPGLYTSPHLVRFEERIRIDGARMPPEDVVRLYRRCMEAVAAIQRREPGYETTFFEVGTAMAFLHFAERGVRLAVLEVGMEGELDATNVCLPLVSGVTMIGHDHTDFLGTDLRVVARRKGGIAKAGAPFVTGVEAPELLEVMKALCRERGTRLWRAGAGGDFRLEREEGGFRFEGPALSARFERLGLLGPHQRANARFALAMLDRLVAGGLAIAEDAVRRGLASVRWPGRMEMFDGPPRVLLDGAHNPSGSEALAAALAEVPRRRLLWVVGVLADKDVPGVVAPIAPLADALYVCAPASGRALEPARLAEILGAPPSRAFPTVEAALEAAMADAGDEDLALVSGSLYVVGEARRRLRGERD